MKVINSVLLASAVLFAGCQGTGGFGKAKPANVTWTNQKPVTFEPAAASELPANTANLVFFREADGMIDQTAVNIGINDRYQASLRGGNYTAIPSCAFNSYVSTQVTGRKTNDLKKAATQYNFTPGENYYFEVAVDGNYVATATPVTPEVALDRLADKQLQSHTISRVVESDCSQPAPPPPREKQVLEDLYLFDFDIRTLDAAENARAVQFANKVKAANFANYQVYLSGFADPMGTDQYNDKLSDDRAKYVAGVYQRMGIPAEKIRLESFGERRPVVEDCASIQNRNERNECNHRNRRVRAQVTEQ